jgi:hypothetical protein
MVRVAALIRDHVKAGHAVQKLRARGIPPEAIRTIARDPAAARAVAQTLVVGMPAAAIITGALTGALAGGMAGWMSFTNVHPLAGPAAAAQALGPPGATLGVAFGLAVGAIMGWMLGRLLCHQQVASYANAVAEGDLLLVVDVPEAQQREVEALLRSYDARRLATGPLPQPTPAPAAGAERSA